MAEGNVYVIPDTAAWRAKLEEAKAAGKTIIVDFTATWCGPCRVIAPIFAHLSEVYPSLIFVKVDVDDLPEIAQEWEVRAMPVFISIKDGQKVGEVVGANPPALAHLCLEASDMMPQT